MWISIGRIEQPLPEDFYVDEPSDNSELSDPKLSSSADDHESQDHIDESSGGSELNDPKLSSSIGDMEGTQTFRLKPCPISPIKTASIWRPRKQKDAIYTLLILANDNTYNTRAFSSDPGLSGRFGNFPGALDIAYSVSNGFAGVGDVFNGIQ